MERWTKDRKCTDLCKNESVLSSASEISCRYSRPYSANINQRPQFYRFFPPNLDLLLRYEIFKGQIEQTTTGLNWRKQRQTRNTSSRITSGNGRNGGTSVGDAFSGLCWIKVSKNKTRKYDRSENKSRWVKVKKGNNFLFLKWFFIIYIKKLDF